VRGRDAVASTFKGRAQAARLAWVDGQAGLVFAPGGQPRVVFDFVIEAGRIIEISLIAEAQTVQAIDLQM
jgi:RNA polymerase sigma-70 factor (ECF subfamily)